MSAAAPAPVDAQAAHGDSDPRSWGPARRAIETADRYLYLFERTVCIAVLGGMGLLVALAVAHREFVRPGGLPSKLESMVLKLVGSPSSGAMVDFGADLMLAVLFWSMALSALRRRVLKGDEKRRPLAIDAGISAAAVAVLGALIYLFVTKVPSFGWPGGVAQAFMVWVGFLGASLATYDRRHLALEMGQKLWPKKALPYVAAFAKLLTALFCLFFMYLAWRSFREHYRGGHRFDAAIEIAGWPNPAYQIPLWFAFVAIPYTFLVMMLRFGKQAVLAVRGEGLEAGSELPSALMDETAGEAPVLETEAVPHTEPKQ